MNNITPNFLCVGAQKAATATLANMLRTHPDVFVPAKKELHYFDQENYQENNSEDYFDCFREGGAYKIRAEFTPDYLYYKEASERIVSLLGKDIKILIILRAPVDRAFSQYRMIRNRGDESLSFKDAFYKERERILESAFNRCTYSYFDRGLYSEQVKRYMELFLNMKIVFFEDFVKQNRKTMKDIYSFLGVNDYEIPLFRSHETVNPKSLIVHLWVKRVSDIIKSMTFLKSDKFLKKIKKNIMELNRKQHKEVLELDEDFLKVLKKHYERDICELEKSLLKI